MFQTRKKPLYKKIYRKETVVQKSVRFQKGNKLIIFSNIFIGIGVLLFLGFIATPAIASVYYANTQSKFVKPFADSVAGYSNRNFSFSELGNSQRKSKVLGVRKDTPEYFSISVPKLGIEDAKVKTNDTDLKPDKHLGHYQGTAIPGEAGNVLVYGHSTLPILYSPTNYKAIFTKVPELAAGDIITVKYANKEYKYRVFLKKELLPEQVNPYETYYADLKTKPTITLLTCTPPGTKKYRYIVVGELVT